MASLTAAWRRTLSATPYPNHVRRQHRIQSGPTTKSILVHHHFKSYNTTYRWNFLLQTEYTSENKLCNVSSPSFTNGVDVSQSIMDSLLEVYIIFVRKQTLTTLWAKFAWRCGLLTRIEFTQYALSPDASWWGLLLFLLCWWLEPAQEMLVINFHLI